MGGRAYGRWQDLPKNRRLQLRIEGEPVAEPDFAQMHASVLYAQRGLPLRQARGGTISAGRST